MKRNLEDVLSKIPTIATQLKIVAAVKAASISSGGESVQGQGQGVGDRGTARKGQYSGGI